MITCSTCASVTRRGAPGRGSSTSPSSRFWTKRCRHRPTVCRVIRNSAAISEFDRPTAHAKMICARCARPCAVVRRRAHCSSVVRSLGLIVTRTVGRPRFAIRASLYQKYERHAEFVSEHQIRDTRERNNKHEGHEDLEGHEELLFGRIPKGDFFVTFAIFAIFVFGF